MTHVVGKIYKFGEVGIKKMNNKLKWHIRFLQLLKNEVATWSKDPSSQVGALIVDDLRIPRGWGYNGPPRGVNDAAERFERPHKYLYAVHAEVNAIYNSHGNLDGCTLYCTHPPCAQCATAIIQNRLTHVVYDDSVGMDYWNRWRESLDAAFTMFEEARIETIGVDLDLQNENSVFEKSGPND